MQKQDPYIRNSYWSNTEGKQIWSETSKTNKHRELRLKTKDKKTLHEASSIQKTTQTILWVKSTFNDAGIKSGEAWIRAKKYEDYDLRPMTEGLRGSTGRTQCHSKKERKEKKRYLMKAKKPWEIETQSWLIYKTRYLGRWKYLVGILEIRMTITHLRQ